MSAEQPDRDRLVTAPAQGARAAMLAAFFLSGVAALVYQIVWAKQLALIFGATVYATSAVVTAFMAGLALGSLYFGRLVDRWRRPLLLFALLQAGIAGFALVFPAITVLIRRAYVVLYGPLGDHRYLMSLARFAMAFTVLLVPTSLMGGTLPVLTRAYALARERLGREVAGLYSVNNFGAFLGCVLAGYVFIEFLGLSGTRLLAVFLNLAAAALALGLGGRRRTLAPPEEADADSPAAPGAACEERAVRVALWVFGIEGFASLALQIAWIRMLIFFVETDIYGVTVIIATYLAGLSLGALLARAWVDRVRNQYRALGLIELGIGISALATIPLLLHIFRAFRHVDQAVAGWGLPGWTIGRFAVCFMVILVPTAFMGATLPVVTRIYARGMAGLGRKMGLLGFLDTAGSILGSFAGGFVMVPLLGIQRTIIATALINLALAVAMFAVDPLARRRRLLRPWLLAAAALLVASPLLLVSRPMPLVWFSRGLAFPQKPALLFYEEDVESCTAVLEEYGEFRSLFVNHAMVAQTTRSDRPAHEMIGHVPMLVHPGPRRALLIGFGIGYTSWACRVHGAAVDVVELSPGVCRANDLFTEANGDILADPAVRLIVDDGRNYVLGTPQQYDVIQAGIIHPALSSGNSGFYTVDFYRECRRVLAPGGVMCQWLPLHGIPVADFKMLVRSFQEAFPHTSIWFKHTGESCTLVGTQEPLRLDFRLIEQRMAHPDVRAHMARCDVHDVYDFLDSFCMAGEAVARMVGEGRLHTDNRPYVEFHCNRPVSPSAHAGNLRLLALGREPVWPHLVNVPDTRRDDVWQRLERWFRSTQHLVSALYLGQVLSSLPPGSPDYARNFAAMRAEFEHVLRANPADRNAAFLWRVGQARHEMGMADLAYRQRMREEAIRRLDRAAEVASGTYEGAEATFLRAHLAGAVPPPHTDP